MGLTLSALCGGGSELCAAAEEDPGEESRGVGEEGVEAELELGAFELTVLASSPFL